MAAVCFLLGVSSVAIGVFYFSHGTGKVLGIVVGAILFLAAWSVQMVRMRIRRQVNQRGQQAPAATADEAPDTGN